MSSNSQPPSGIPISKPPGILYTFAKAGDVLSMHFHGEADVHITCIMRGRFLVRCSEGWEREYEAGAFIDWAVGAGHEFVALTDNARIGNFLKNVEVMA